MIREALKQQLAFTHGSARRNLEGVTNEESRVAGAGGANCINWVLGHMVTARNAMLGLLGGEPVMDAEGAAVYARHSQPIAPGSTSRPLEELNRLFDASQVALLERLDTADGSLFDRQVPRLFDPDEREPVGVQLATLAFHEAYHAGQLGVLRRAVGKEGAIS